MSNTGLRYQVDAQRNAVILGRSEAETREPSVLGSHSAVLGPRIALRASEDDNLYVASNG